MPQADLWVYFENISTIDHRSNLSPQKYRKISLGNVLNAVGFPCKLNIEVQTTVMSRKEKIPYNIDDKQD